MKNWIHPWWCACLALMLAGRLSAAENDISYDLTFKTGLAAGIVKQSRSNDTGLRSSQSFNLGGIPLALAYYRDLMPSLTTIVQGQMLLDLVNQQISRRGIEGGLAYHVIGGVRRIEVGAKGKFHQVSQSKMNLSLSLREGLFSYEASNKKTTATELAGATFETRGGVEYRRDLGENSALTVELISTLFSVRASRERIEPVMTELLMGYRTLF